MTLVRRAFIVLIALALLALAAGVAAVGSPKLSSSMQVTYEYFSVVGYEGDLTDGCLGPDETWVWQVRGDLAPGASYSYTYQPNCAPREIVAYASVSKGRRPDLTVTIRAFYNGEWHEVSGVGRACISWYWSDMTPHPWEVVVTNPASYVAREVYFQGKNRMQIGVGCEGF